MNRGPEREEGRGLLHLLLVGGGHAHVRVLRSLAEDAWPPVSVTLVSPHRAPLYSGMVPGYLQGLYRLEELSLDLPALCRRAGARFTEGRVVEVDSRKRTAIVDSDGVSFDLASLDVGSRPQGSTLPGVAENALTLRPMGAAVALRRRVDAMAGGDGAVRIAVVGSGTGGVEVALALDWRVREMGGVPSVLLLDRGPEILPGYAPRARRMAVRVLRRAGIAVLQGREVASVGSDGLRLTGGAAVEADVVVWSTGPSPPPIIARSTLTTSPAGYFSVDDTLRASDGVPVWGAGDCVDVQGHDLPKAGVYAVRQGPVLARNLRAALTGEPVIRYRPQRAFLSLLNSADGKAVLAWRRIAIHARAAWWLKDAIDRRWVARYS